MSSYIYEVIKPEPDIPVKCFSYRYPIDYFVSAHWHNSIEVLRITEGRMQVTIGKRREELEQGAIIIINSREIHATFGEQNTSAEVLQIPYSFLKRYLPDVEQHVFVQSPVTEGSGDNHSIRQMGELIHNMCQLMTQRRDSFLVEFHADLFQLIKLLYTEFSSQVSKEVAEQDDSNRKRLTKVMDYVNMQYRDRISLEDAASLVALNKEYFCRFFKRYMGMTLMEYVHEVRFSHVCDDLFSTDENIMVVLQEHGFTNYKLFMRMFRDRYHGTPSQMRHSVRRNTKMPKYGI